VAEIFNIPSGPIDTEPVGAIVPDPSEPAFNARLHALHAALAGVELGGYDETILSWLAGWEPATVATVCSWLYRVRALGYEEPEAEVEAAVQKAESLGHAMERDLHLRDTMRWRCTRCYLAAWDLGDRLEGGALEQTCADAMKANERRLSRG
jgi:hypothetical protein